MRLQKSIIQRSDPTKSRYLERRGRYRAGWRRFDSSRRRSLSRWGAGWQRKAGRCLRRQQRSQLRCRSLLGSELRMWRQRHTGRGRRGGELLTLLMFCCYTRNSLLSPRKSDKCREKSNWWTVRVRAAQKIFSALKILRSRRMRWAGHVARMGE
jgi:hypothetical protein